MTKIYVGRINSFHGIKGELKILSDFEYKDRVFKKNVEVFIDDEEHIITSSRVHKNNYLVTIDGLYDINLVNDFVHKDLFIDRDILKLRSNEYLSNELIGFSLYDNDEMIGEVINIVYNVNSKFLYVSGTKNYYVPIIDEYIDVIDIKEKKIYTKGGKELIL